MMLWGENKKKSINGIRNTEYTHKNIHIHAYHMTQMNVYMKPIYDLLIISWQHYESKARIPWLCLEQVRSQTGWIMLCESFHASKPDFPLCKLGSFN